MLVQICPLGGLYHSHIQWNDATSRAHGVVSLINMLLKAFHGIIYQSMGVHAVHRADNGIKLQACLVIG